MTGNQSNFKSKKMGNNSILSPCWNSPYRPSRRAKYHCTQKSRGDRRPKACRPWFPMNPCHSCFPCFLHHMARPVPLVRASRKSKKPADHRPEGIMVLLAHRYKLNSVCNADVYPLSGWFSPESPKGYAQKSITRIA